MPKFHLKLLALAAGAIALVSCATATPYGPSDGRYGYSEQRIEDDRYRVTFSGNSSTSRETVERFFFTERRNSRSKTATTIS